MENESIMFLDNKDRAFVEKIFSQKRGTKYELTGMRNVKVNGREVGFIRKIDHEKNQIVVASLNFDEPKFNDFILNKED